MKLSKKRRDELKKIKDSDIDYSDIPETNKEFWKDAEIIMPSAKHPITMRLDEQVIDWFKKEGRGYQTRINTVLLSYVAAQKSKQRKNRRQKTDGSGVKASPFQ